MKKQKKKSQYFNLTKKTGKDQHNKNQFVYTPYKSCSAVISAGQFKV